MPANPRLAGHVLQHEGAPYRLDGERFFRVIPHFGYAAKGRGLCSCGDYSSPLPSAASRKRWHQAHKDDVRASSS